MSPPPPSLTPPVSVSRVPLTKQSLPACSIRDVFFKRIMSTFVELHSKILVTCVHMSYVTSRVAAPPPRVAPNNVVDKPIAHHIRSSAPPPMVVSINGAVSLVAYCIRSLKISPVATSACAFLSEFISRWAMSEVLHGTSHSVLDVETGKSLEQYPLRCHLC